MNAAASSLPTASRHPGTARTRRIVAAGLMLGLVATAGRALPLEVTLAGKLESADGEYIVRVENRDHETSSFQWFIDEQPVTPSTVDRAGELVFFARPSATAIYRVVVTDANGTQAMGMVRLDPGTWTVNSAPAFAAPSKVQINRLAY